MIAAFFVHWAILVPKMIPFLREALSWKQMMRPRLFSLDVHRMIKPFFLGILGAGAMQINSALDAIFSRYASLEAPAYLWYAIRIEQVPLGLFGVAFSAALLPSLSRSYAAMDIEKFKDLLSYAMKKTFSLMFPSFVALFVLGAAGVNFVYGRGGFCSSDSFHTLLCLWGYGLGLIPTAIVMLLAPAFYAKKNFRIPTIASSLAVALNILLNYLFVFHLHLGALSIALATSLASLANMLALVIFLRKRIDPLTGQGSKQGYVSVALCSLFAGVMTLLLGHFLLDDPTVSILLGKGGYVFSRSFITQLLQLFVMGGFFMLFLISYAWVFGVDEILTLVGVKKKVLPSPSSSMRS
jgi:putative peptidoglycan lipid II flippase